jgi:hypothetical protein
VTNIKLSKREVSTLINALVRAVDWSDINENEGALGKVWARRERRFIRDCKMLEHRLWGARQ